jgi:ribosomal protein S12
MLPKKLNSAKHKVVHIPISSTGRLVIYYVQSIVKEIL